MKKINLYGLMAAMVGVFFLPLGAIPANQSNTAKEHHSKSTSASAVEDEDEDDEDEYDILERDEVDDTDTLAIPLDDSEVEDEEEINLAEKKEVFHLPHAR